MKIERRAEPEYRKGEGFLVDKNQKPLTGKVDYFFRIDPDEQSQPMGFTQQGLAKRRRVEVSIFTQERLGKVDGELFLKTKEGELLLRLLRAEEALLNEGQDPYYSCTAELLE